MAIGLTTAEVNARIEAGEVNVVEFRSTRSYKEIFQENIFTVFHISFGIVLVLLTLLGQSTDAFFSGVTILSNIVVGVFQEIKAKLALDKLALLSVQQVTVIRDGVELIIPLQEVVRDDVIKLQPGDRPPVDGEVIVSDALEMDESLLTGESDPVAKAVTDGVMSGTFCVAGSGLFRATKIGSESYAAQISHTSRTYKRSLTPLQKKINTVVEIFVLALLLAGFLHLIASLNSGRTPVDTLRYAAVIINSFVPAGLILSISVALALGAVEISKKQTLIQRINAVDSMNSVRILCTDKTGTLTQNHLLMQELVPLNNYDYGTVQEFVALYVTLLSNRNSSANAIYAFVGHPLINLPKKSEVPFSSGRKWGAITLGDRRTIIIGAPEVIFIHTPAIVQDYGRQGIRVLGVAISTSELIDNSLPLDREAIGLILLKDELRGDVVNTIAQLQAHGIEIKVISGDSADTVAAIAHQAGIAVNPETTFTQADLDSFSPKKFNQAALTGLVFARITPDTKRQLVRAMVKSGGYVAMVGDGVNDVPAFKEAQLAIAMHDGAQISKDVADIILLNNSLATLPQAFQAGDEIKQKILASALLYLTKNMMVIFTISFVGFVQLPFPIEPRQLTLMTFFLVSVPAILIAMGVFQLKRLNNFLKDVLGYSLLAGLIGALAMTLGYMLAYFGSLGLNGIIETETILEIGRQQAQAVSTLIGMVYCLLVFWDACRISIWRPKTVFKWRFPMYLGIFMFFLSALILLVLPELFQVALPDRLGWSLILFLPFTANYILRLLQCSSFLRQLRTSLTQP